ncbi:hypothetical protein ACWPM1_13770 [Tsuneonella sp. HG249]
METPTRNAPWKRWAALAVLPFSTGVAIVALGPLTSSGVVDSGLVAVGRAAGSILAGGAAHIAEAQLAGQLLVKKAAATTAAAASNPRPPSPTSFVAPVQTSRPSVPGGSGETPLSYGEMPFAPATEGALFDAATPAPVGAFQGAGGPPRFGSVSLVAPPAGAPPGTATPPLTQAPVSAVPDAATWLTLIVGFAAVASVLRRRRKRRFAEEPQPLPRHAFRPAL